MSKKEDIATLYCLIVDSLDSIKNCVDSSFEYDENHFSLLAEHLTQSKKLCVQILSRAYADDNR
jgi:hypothetical protein